MRRRFWLIARVSLAVALSLACEAGTPSRVAPQDGADRDEAEGRAQVHLPAWGVPFVVRQRPLTEQLRTAEVARDLTDPSLGKAIASSDPEEYVQGVWALSRIGGEGALALLLPTLDAAKGPVADRSVVFSALALLQPPDRAPGLATEPSGRWRDLEDALWSRYAVTERSAEARALLLGIARIGGERSSARLAVDLAPLPVQGAADRYHSAMEALGILCSRGHALSGEGLDAVAQGLSASDPTVRNGAAYALGRCVGPSAELLAGPERAVLVRRLQPMVESLGNAEGARLAWRALAALGEIPEPIPDAILADPELSWQVDVQAVRALGGNAKGRKLLVERLAALDLGAFGGAKIHGVLDALRVLRPSIAGTPELLGPLEAFERRAVEVRGRVDAADRRGIAHAICELRLLQAIGSGKLEKLLACADDQLSWPGGYADGLAVEALLHMDTSEEEKFVGLRERAEGGQAVVAARALAALAEVEEPQVNEVLRAALGRRDVGVVAAAAGAIAARAADSDKRDPEAVDGLVMVIRELRNGDAVEARIAAIEALGSLARGSVSSDAAKDATAPQKPANGSPAPWLASTILPLADDPSPAVRQAALDALWGHDQLRDQFATLSSSGSTRSRAREVEQALLAATEATARGLRMHTEKGVIGIDFTGAPAPVGQHALAALAERGYFDGLRWHRVVPDFVIQGGDPRGDGYGGPGYLLPCEWSNLAYERGTVGIALAGKDTGGSQIFITQSRQPHLDGRYTVIGRVTEGLDVLDRIVGQDVIERVEVVRAQP